MTNSFHSQTAPSFKDVKAAKERALERARSQGNTDTAAVSKLADEFKRSADRGAARFLEFIAGFDALYPAPLPEGLTRKPDRLVLALTMAARGFRVFPCKADTCPGREAKEPACQWQQDATTDPAIIRDWFRERPGMNYGVAMPAGRFVLDLDCKDDANGRDVLGGLEIDYDAMPATLTVRTPSGGEHVYLAGSAPNSVRKKELGRAIDVRGNGGYVVGPGSMVDGKLYEIIDDRDVAAAPDWLLKLAAKATVEPAKRDPNVKLGAPAEIDRMRAHLKNLVEQGDMAIEHCGGNNRTYELFCEVLDHLPEDFAYDLVAELWNPACVPPWGDDELRKICASAVAYRQNEIGTRALPPVGEAFKDALEKLPHEAPKNKKKNLLRSVSFAALMSRPVEPIHEIIPGLIEKGIATMLSGPGGVHKSRLAQQIGLSIQAGIPIFGHITEPCTFIYVDYENGVKEITRRTHKMRSRLGLPPDTAGHYIDLKSGPDAARGPLPANDLSPALALIEETGITCLPLYFELYDFLRATPGHKIVVADSCYNLLNFTGQTKVNENSVKAALNLLDYLCAATDSTMLYLWHPSQAGQDRGDASGWSVAWHNTPRARLSLSAVKDTPDAFDLKVEKRNNGRAGGVITLHWQDGVLLPLSAMENTDRSKLFFEACITAAFDAHASGAPLQKQRNAPGWAVTQIERAAGFKPSQKQIKEQLEAALRVGRLRYVAAYGKTIAGYYPVETDPEMLRLIGLDTAKEPRALEHRANDAGGETIEPAPGRTDDDLPPDTYQTLQ
jgi:hypothetical protein